MILITRLIWDDWNMNHIAPHGVTPREVEEACHSEHLSWQSYNDRLVLIGITNAPKILAVVLAPQADEGVYYVVTARIAHKKERQLYRDYLQRGGDHDRSNENPDVH